MPKQLQVQSQTVPAAQWLGGRGRTQTEFRCRGSTPPTPTSAPAVESFSTTSFWPSTTLSGRCYALAYWGDEYFIALLVRRIGWNALILRGRFRCCSVAETPRAGRRMRPPTCTSKGCV